MTDILTLPCMIEGNGLRLLRPQLEFAPLLYTALKRSYVFHKKFLRWPKADLSLIDVHESLQRSVIAFGSLGFEVEKKYYIFAGNLNVLVGWIGVRYLSERRCYSLGYWLNVDCEGQGYMTKALKLVIPLIKSCPTMLFISEHNEPSKRLAVRVGFRLYEKVVGDRKDSQFGSHDTLIYRIENYGK